MEVYKPAQYWEARLSKDFSIANAGFCGMGRPFNEWLYKGRLRALNKFFREYKINPKDKILALACGTGFYIDYYSKLGAKSVTGIDITQKSVTELGKSYPQYVFMRKDISTELGLKGKYDIVTAFDVLFHIVDAEKFENAIENAQNHCSDDGYVLITEELLHKAPDYDGKHFRSRTQEEYEKALTKKNLRIVKEIPTFYLLNTSSNVSNGLPAKITKYIWKMAMFLISKNNAFGFFWGALLYYGDSIMLRLPIIRPAHKLIICKKIKKA